MSLAGIRKQRSDLPNRPTLCNYGHEHACVYCPEEATCDSPAVNKGNSDALCHRWSNKRLLQVLSKDSPR